MLTHLFHQNLCRIRKYRFYDEFHANSSDKWLWDKWREYTEEYDYNGSDDFPDFKWTDDLINNNWKV
jgi:hypothetical protein